MPVLDNRAQIIDGQNDFSGGMVDLPKAPPNSYKFARNVEIRDSRLTTRRAVKAAYPKLGALTVGFFFNQDNYKLNDDAHNGFWFPFSFANEVLGVGNLQGSATIRSADMTERRFIICLDGKVFVIGDGYSDKIPTVYTINVNDRAYFVQAANRVYLFLGPSENSESRLPMVWDFGGDGFVPVPEPSVKIEAAGTEGDPDYQAPIMWDAAPAGRNPVYHLGRLWVWINKDEVVASDILDFNNWDLTLRRYAINFGDGNSGTALHPMGRNELLACKTRSISILSDLNDPELANIKRFSLSDNIGVVSEGAICSDGSQAWFMSYEGIWYLFRNEFGQLQMSQAPISLPVQPLIDRINWAAAAQIDSAIHENYVMFAVPLDGSLENNAIFVFDRLLRVFVGLWDGEMVRLKKFLAKDDKMYFVNQEGRIKQMFCDDYYDSQAPADDFAAYDFDTVYYPGRVITYGQRQWLCLKKNKLYDVYNPGDISEPERPRVTTYEPNAGIVVTVPVYTADEPEQVVVADTAGAYWQEVTDPSQHVQIVTELITRNIHHNDEATDKRAGICEVVVSHLSPRINLSVIDEDPRSEQVIYNQITYDRLKYDTDNRSDWNPGNSNLDFNYPDRQDYDLFIPPTGGIYMDQTGLEVFARETHSLRWIPFSVNERGANYRIYNDRGHIAVRSLVVTATPTRFANRER